MSETMYQSTLPVFTHHLKNLIAVLKIAADDASARNIDPSVLLVSRLAPDMFPLIRQVQIATDHAKGCCARLAGVTPPVTPDEEVSFAELEQRITDVLAFLDTLKTSAFDGSEARAIEINTPKGDLHFSGVDYVQGWAFPNFYFHLTMAYAILRHNGVALGKKDFIGKAPGMSATGEIAKMLRV